MNKDKYVFAQLVEFLDCFKFRRIVAKYKGDRYVKHLTCRNQFLAMMVGQLANRESLRDLIVALDAHRSKCYHLGLGKNISKSSLSRANQDRDYRIFEEFAFFHITPASTRDSKTMSEIPYETGSYYIFDRAYNKFKQLYGINRIGAYFVVRAKKNLQYKVIKWKRRLPLNVLSDSTIELTTYKSSKDYPKRLRLVRYYDEEQDREFVFLTICNSTGVFTKSCRF